MNWKDASPFKREPEPVVSGPLPSLAVCIVTMKPELVAECICLAEEHASEDFEIYVWANACDYEHKLVHVTSSKTNEGVVGPMDQLWRKTNADIVAFIHDDLEIYEDGWDLRLRRRFAASPDCVLVGFGGAQSLGRADMYTCGSEIEPTRGPFGSNLTAPKGREKEMTTAEVHGPRIDYDCKAATIDGFAAVVRRTFLEQIDGFAEWPIVHHGYDSFLACMVRRHKKETWLCPIKMGHPWIGGTSQSKEGLELLGKDGGNHGLFLKAHTMLREKFKDVLPFGFVPHVSVEPFQALPIYENYFGSVKVDALPENPTARFAVDLLERLAPRPGMRAALEDTMSHDVPGDVVGGGALCAGILKAYSVLGRRCWTTDDAEEIARLGLDGMPLDPGSIHRLAVLRVRSLEELALLYPRLSKGGHVFCDGFDPAPYRAAHGISEPMVGGSWKRDKFWWVPLNPTTVTLVIPTLTEAGAARTKKLIETSYKGTRPPDNVFVIDNGGAFASQFLFGVTAASWGDLPFKATVHTPDKNLGVAASWNLALSKFGDWMIFVNDDAEIESDTIERFVKAAEASDKVLITCEVGQGFPMFLLKQAAVRAIGNFDERFFAYYEDTDYIHRMKRAGQVPLKIDAGVKHSEHGGTTSREAGLTGLLEASAKEYEAKWGGPPGRERGPAAAQPVKKASTPVVSVQGYVPKQNRFKR